MQLRVTSDEVVDSPFADAKQKKFRKVVGTGVTDFSEQFVEIQLPESHPPVGVGTVADFHVRSVSSLFQGKARLQGTFSMPSKK